MPRLKGPLFEGKPQSLHIKICYTSAVALMLIYFLHHTKSRLILLAVPLFAVVLVK